MKKLLTLVAILALSSSAFAAGNSPLANAIKNDVNSAKESIKSTSNALSDAVKQDVANKKQARANVAAQKKAEKIKYLDNKIDELEKRRKIIKEDKTITETERTIRLRAIDAQIDGKKKEKAALSK